MGAGSDLGTVMTYVMYLVLFILAIVIMFSLFKINYNVTFNYDKEFKYSNTVMKYLASSSCFIYKKDNTYPLPYVINLSYIRKNKLENCIPMDSYELIFYLPYVGSNLKDKRGFIKEISNKRTEKLMHVIVYPVLYYDEGNYYSGVMILRVFR